MTPDGTLAGEGTALLLWWLLTVLSWMVVPGTIRYLVLAGINGHACVRVTAIDAYQCDYEVVLATDGVASADPEDHAVSRRYLAERIATPLDTDPLVRPGDGGVASTTVLGDWPEGVGAAVEAGVMPPGDSVGIALSPRITHGPLSLFGRLVGDRITGRWAQRTGHAPRVQGSFVRIRREGCGRA